jgi:hypothetical protein
MPRAKSDFPAGGEEGPRRFPALGRDTEQFLRTRVAVRARQLNDEVLGEEVIPNVSIDSIRVDQDRGERRGGIRNIGGLRRPCQYGTDESIDFGGSLTVVAVIFVADSRVWGSVALRVDRGLIGFVVDEQNRHFPKVAVR